MAIPLLSAKDLSFYVNGENLFENLTLVVHEGEKCAFIGPNGAGKSTLLKMLNGDLIPDSGEVILSRKARSSYVPQKDSFTTTTVQKELESKALKAGLDGKDAAREISKLLTLAGFDDKDHPINELSGGWKKRLAIICGLIGDPNLLLLDEPTNHLDIEGIEWLEKLVSSTPAAVVFISHDRYLIENAAQRVIELKRTYPNGLLSVEGAYTTFLDIRENFLAQQESYRQSLNNKVRNEIEWLRKGAKARTTKQKGRIKWAGELIQELSDLKVDRRPGEMNFQSTDRKTQELIKLEKVDFSYGALQVCKNFSYILRKNSRLGIVGANGSGKTTLIKLMLNNITPKKGNIERANSLKVASLDQMRSAIEPNKTLKESLCPEGDSVVVNERQQHVVGWARRFGFSHEQLGVQVKNLSGGEQARVLIATLMSQPADILVLDEPTNDLDIDTIELLEQSILEFPGAVVIVSHDRALLDRVSTEVVGMVPTKGAILFADHNQWSDAVDEILSRNPDLSGIPKRGVTEVEESRTANDFEQLIAKQERIVEELGEKVADPALDNNPEELSRRCDLLAEAQEKLDKLYSDWEATLE